MAVKKPPVKRKKKEKTQEEKKIETIKKCLIIIEQKNVVFINELCAYLPISRETFYEWGLHESYTLREAINNSKICRKSNMRHNWETSENPTLQLASYRLMAEPEEHRALSTNYTDITTGGDKITMPYNLTDKQREERIKELRGEISDG